MIRKHIIIALIISLVSVIYGIAFAQDLNSPNVSVIDKYKIKGPKHFHTGYAPGDTDGNVSVIIEIPKGTTGKWEASLENGTINWEFKNGKPRTVTYKGGNIANCGSIQQTRLPKKIGGDGDPVDVVVLGAPILDGEVVKVKIIGVLNLMEDGEFDGKLIALKKGSPEYRATSVKI